ncbi:cbb3-type cytochrome c oxidase subunit 3 [Caldimonas thermodepolymerans]|uniref:CcoQ/FixQ family Cbb3-type cytochrome c oxidase assembly chaperone n=1 Tax=Caldimonas thermodepolymerans TaxID=215580 RepID=A0A2S5T6A5_9BURK|nr:cbb3-type cytochrome c oxidase subunit 3 [Caldimonas thermodepolymerans]PPE70533.1 CcoQ/FixQ family Cbb3-type cytochrome c oxidase assembly chaperone [Caldimonas thermodepolymerans]QPC33408.1 cbb3-type cytochrome c oxidase subunit 3 [Caldimonas thermodepolymerans]UZG46161.1 cbb3-type cytochrome c oxidase subunit 3 [Caldimonas thermodepolymerans]UZG49951.1 cbb3-type cytochrome c oxidase subunit 3 [Caldimonas thermodepolymerans]
MDINDLRSIVTVVSLALFLGICWWAYRRSNRGRFDEAAQVPFLSE